MENIFRDWVFDEDSFEGKRPTPTQIFVFFGARGVIVFGLVVRTRVILLIKDFRRKIKLFFASTFASSQLQIGVVIRSIDTSEEASR